MRFFHIHTALLLTLGLTLASCGKDDAAKTGTTTTPGDTATTTITPTESTGYDFKSDAGKFSIKLPAGFPQPIEESTPLPLPDGNGSVDLKTFSSQTEDKANAAMFSYSDMTGKLETKGREKAMLDASRDNVLKEMNATLEKEQDINIDGNPGRMMIFSLSDGTETYQGRLHMYVVGPFSYQVMYISKDRAALESPAVNAYFDSFKLAG